MPRRSASLAASVRRTASRERARIGVLGIDLGGVFVEKVLEKLGTTESTTLAVRREESVKIRVASLLWGTPKVILPGAPPSCGQCPSVSP
jgi:hypothetical protein